MRNRACTSLVATALLLTACGGDKSTGSGGGTVLVSMSSDAGFLFPLLVQDETGKAISDILFDHLADIGDGMNTAGDAGFTPRLAKSWDWAKDSMSITYHINPAATFHDGVPVRASDVRYTFKLTIDPALNSPSAPLVSNIDSVSVVDSTTAKVWFKRRSAEQFYDVAYQLPIVPEHIYGKVKPADMSTSDVLRNPVGSGRFRFVKWEPGAKIELVADTSNYMGRAKLDRVVFLLDQAPPAATTSVLTGETDFYSAVPIDQSARLDSSAVAHSTPYVQLGYGFLAMNLHARKSQTQPNAIFADKAVRRAVSMSIDRAAMLSNVFNKHGIPAYGPFPRDVATADTTLRVPAYDTVAAKALLDSAGWTVGPKGIRQKNGRPLKFEIMLPTSSASRMRFADLIQESLGRVGIQVDLARLPAPAFFERQDATDFDATISAINTDPSVSGTKQYWTTQGVKAKTDFVGYATTKTDALLDSATLGGDPAKAKRYATAAYQSIADDVPAVWLYTLSSVAGMNRRIDMAPFRSDGWWIHLADWSIPADKRIARDKIGLQPPTP